MRGIKIAVLLAVGTIVSIPALPGRASSASAVGVHISGRASGSLPAPCNCVADIVVAVNAAGTADALEGSGINHPSTGAINRFSVTGTTDGSLVVLSGTIFQSTFPPLVGSPVEIEADAATGELTFTLGPIAGGPFAGQTLVFVGSGHVVITGD